MSHFYGTVAGAGDTEATRTGHKSTGIRTAAASFKGSVRVYVRYDETRKVDTFRVAQEPWHEAGVSETLASGVLGQEAGRFSALTADEKAALHFALDSAAPKAPGTYDGLARTLLDLFAELRATGLSDVMEDDD